MAYYDLEEQEQLAALRAWWKRWGALCLLGMGLALAAVAGYQGWNWYKGRQAIEASELYDSLMKSVNAGDAKKARDAATQLTDRYASSGYAALGALLVSRLHFQTGDLAGAKQNLQWVIDKSRDEDFKSVARLRLAAVLLDQKQFDAALAVLDVKQDHPMSNLYADLRGDVFLAKGSKAQARAAYQTALEKTDARSAYRNLIQFKIDALGPPK